MRVTVTGGGGTTLVTLNGFDMTITPLAVAVKMQLVPSPEVPTMLNVAEPDVIGAVKLVNAAPQLVAVSVTLPVRFVAVTMNGAIVIPDWVLAG